MWLREDKRMTKNQKPGAEIETRKEDLETPAPKRRKLKGVHSNKNNITTPAGKYCTCSAKERRWRRTDNKQSWRDR